ncbi:MAG: TIM barrel protein [Chloroflexota bacterium]
MSGLVFGTGGVPNSTRTRSTAAGIEHIKELGLGGMEVEFVRGVRMSDATAQQVRETATRLGIKLSAHAPYYINFNSHDPEQVKASQRRLSDTVRVASLCGAETVVFHPAFYGGDPPEEAYENVKGNLKGLVKELRACYGTVWLRPEVAGKVSEFGGLEEVLNLCSELGGMLPAIDFAHWHARTGEMNSYDEFSSVLDQLQKRLGATAIQNMHMHISGIAYGKKGELKHLNLRDSDLNYTELMKALKEHKAGGMVICESPNLEDDARLMQDTYNSR